MAFRMVLSLRMRLETSSRYTCATSARRTVFLLGEMSSRFLMSSMDVFSLGSMRRTMFQWSWFLITSPSFWPFMAVETCSAAFAMVRPWEARASWLYCTRMVSTMISRLARASATSGIFARISLAFWAARRSWGSSVP